MNSSLSCENCLRLCSSPINLLKHQQKCKSSGLNFKCKYCNKLLSSKQNRKEHEFTHTGELPYVCKVTECGLRFRQGSLLSSHKRIHLTIEKYISQENCKWIRVTVTQLTELIQNENTKTKLCIVENITEKIEIPLITKPQAFNLSRHQHQNPLVNFKFRNLLSIHYPSSLHKFLRK